jgi:hypothetical protein
MSIRGAYYHPNLFLIPALLFLPYATLAVISFSNSPQPDFFSSKLLVPIGLPPLLGFVGVGIDLALLRRHIHRNGDRLTAVKWAPFGPSQHSWLSIDRKYFTVYQVEISDSKHHVSKAYVRVSLFHGISFTG